MHDQILPGHTLAEDERILLSRTAFLRHFLLGDPSAEPPRLPDPRVTAFLLEIEHEAGLLAAADRFAKVATLFAQRIGVAHRSALWLAPPEELIAAIDAVPVTDEYRASFEETQSARAAAGDAFRQVDHAMFAARLEVFVRGLGLPWRWLALEIAEHYFVRFYALLLGRQLHQERRLAWAPAHPFQPEPDEDLEAAFTHQAQTLELAVQWYVKAHRRSKHAGPKADGQHLERYAEWFYRRDVKQPGDAFGRIARDHKTSSGNVKRGIAVVEPLLNRDRLP